MESRMYSDLTNVKVNVQGEGATIDPSSQS